MQQSRAETQRERRARNNRTLPRRGFCNAVFELGMTKKLITFHKSITTQSFKSAHKYACLQLSCTQKRFVFCMRPQISVCKLLHPTRICLGQTLPMSGSTCFLGEQASQHSSPHSLLRAERHGRWVRRTERIDRQRGREDRHTDEHGRND